MTDYTNVIIQGEMVGEENGEEEKEGGREEDQCL